ncbi:OLC1v1035811C2 [Oldenlandia corymbosa var. corymbosa]|uniref:OLC1v1035811C2 n=1 Tax=Oldenlandia corymbosa var. corymbosa TaxID=529605 RepID=A0AAV1CUH8_OLDCO|nr:OLC1v1035811C2 [Oldenlandia corymbosa var. corymbosa]
MPPKKGIKRSKKVESKAENKPTEFFKVFNPETSTDKIMLPTAWTKEMQGKLPTKALLRDRYGNIWHVKLTNDQEKTYFHQGWTTFIQQNYLEKGDFIIFKFDGIHVFNVRILGYDSCDKRGVGSLKYKLQEEDKEVVAVHDNADANSNNVNGEGKESDQPFKAHIGSINVRGGNGKDEVDRCWKKNRLVDPFGYKLFKSGKVHRPENPHFVTQINPTRRYGLFVPLEIIKVYNLELPVKTFLRDYRGREWKTDLTMWKDNRSWYHNGWKELCQANLIEPDEPCICEFVKSEERGLFIQVHIVPKAAWESPMK